MPETPAPAARRRLFLGVALTSLCVLMLQLALTRLFSATMHYHFAFLAISLALFGSGAAGVMVYAFGDRFDPQRTPAWLARFSLLFALTTALALLVVLGNPVAPDDRAGRTVLRLALIYVAGALPFLCAGGAVALAVSRLARDISRLYLFDLCGAAAGCLLLIPTIELLGAVNAVLAVAALAAFAGALFAASAEPAGRLRWACLLAGAALLALTGINVSGGHIDVRRAKGRAEGKDLLFARWNSFSRVTVRGRLDEDRLLIEIDADAAATLSRDGHRLERHAAQRGRVEALAYHLRPTAKAMIIGPGGGDDVIIARLLGAREVTAVEITR